ncbi:hypothetical protein ACRALDRAFT_2039045 [Sodiomyces alcalophilus JCM 7366]|uniref:uncharacterized protein n=1 Tax=Sodiomyces alcalophilus JCM 7366 TaxID=591952 RepID=UPI0039B41F34
MDDLSGLDWSSTTSKPTNKAPSIPSGANYFGSMQHTPSPLSSARNTPVPSQHSQPKPAAPSATTGKALATDSFSNLLSFGSAKSNEKLSLREQQERLEVEKRRKEEEKKKQLESQFGDGQFWDTLGSRSAARTASPAISSQGPLVSGQSMNGTKADDDDDDDLFAAFNAETKVDNSSHYPPPPEKKPPPSVEPVLDLSDPSAWSQSKPAQSMNTGFGDDDDDPFGLNQLKDKGPAPRAAPQPLDDDDDFLGDLARPVEDVRRKQPPPQPRQPEPGKPIEDSSSDSEDEPAARGARGPMDEFDRAVAQLTDYGFSTEDARRGLTESGAGLNVQAAANWLLDDAHRRAKAKAEGRDPSAGPRRGRESSRHESPRRTDNRSPAMGDDFQKTAAAVGSSFLKTANSLWKTGKKQVAQAYAEFSHEGDPSQPKWMRAAAQGEMRASAPRHEASVTDEALMLEAGMRPERKPSPRSHLSRPEPPRTASRGPSPATQSPASSSRSTPVPRWQQSAPIIPDSKARASRLAMEDDSASSYVSPHRRRKATPQPQPPPRPQAGDEEDLLFGAEASKPSPSLPQRPARQAQPAERPTASATPRPTPPPARQIPDISPSAIQQSAKHRLDGTQHFKRGDYAAAHSSYSASLAAVPDTHPLAIVILTNRALTSLKNGEPKKAVDDADAALKVIGPSGGQGEHVTVTNESGAEERRDMPDLYGKALSRKAEALEQMERWADAAAVWQLCVEAGVGGSTAIAGRQRCQAALAPKPKPKPQSRPAAAPTRPRPTAPAVMQKSSEAVERLRKQNQAAEAEDEEKFELSEKVDARISAWRDGKRDNLRALLASLHTVLWEGSGWRQVGLHELVMPNKVKIVYMKAIAKCHPDKVPQDASTETRLIAGTVFATLNESWDKFKADNSL